MLGYRGRRYRPSLARPARTPPCRPALRLERTFPHYRLRLRRAAGFGRARRLRCIAEVGTLVKRYREPRAQWRVSRSVHDPAVPLHSNRYGPKRIITAQFQQAHVRLPCTPAAVPEGAPATVTSPPAVSAYSTSYRHACAIRLSSSIRAPSCANSTTVRGTWPFTQRRVPPAGQVRL